MIAKSCPTLKLVYAYDKEQNVEETKQDVTVLYSLASKSRPTKLVAVFGGIHGTDPAGVPFGQGTAEKPAEGSNPMYWAGSSVVSVGGTKVTSFALDDAALKGPFKGLNFKYTSLGKYVSAGTAMSAEKQKEILKLIKQYHDSGNYYVLLAWCFSHTWAVANGL